MSIQIDFVNFTHKKVELGGQMTERSVTVVKCSRVVTRLLSGRCTAPFPGAPHRSWAEMKGTERSTLPHRSLFVTTARALTVISHVWDLALASCYRILLHLRHGGKIYYKMWGLGHPYSDFILDRGVYRQQKWRGERKTKFWILE